ncbi:hypothetical protein [Mycolicibacterium sp. 050158]|uniref:hypothetical protein n=1 Tax=Mycolicibacterium sp. 050158 TaxID=3090602 RepID=UPI00299E5A73|nr:hypothetical protein [Mycolicibacterium sp. 050158]MDX1893418.1 hypothetical protein [Mycolicibacterium sp. 050158]
MGHSAGDRAADRAEELADRIVDLRAAKAVTTDDVTRAVHRAEQSRARAIEAHLSAADRHHDAAVAHERAATVHDHAASSSRTDDAAVHHREAAQAHRQGAVDDERHARRARGDAARDTATVNVAEATSVDATRQPSAELMPRTGADVGDHRNGPATSQTSQ